MASNIGEPVDDLVLLRPDGTQVRLSDYPARPLLLIFLRHLG